MSELLDWLAGLFGDCVVRAPFGVRWDVDRERPPLVVSVTGADMPTDHIEIDHDDIGGRLEFASRVQAVIGEMLDRPVPSCPAHGLGLASTRVGDQIAWVCPEDDFRCGVGEYEQSAFWPPTRTDRWSAPMLAKRFAKYGVLGLSSFSVRDRDGLPVAQVAVRPDADRRAVREAAAPLAVEFSDVPAIGTAREWHPATERQPAHETLTLTGVAMHLALLRGVLHRARPGDDCDFLVGGTSVCLGAAHVIGGPGNSLLQDTDGVAFADEGDEVSCVGGAKMRGRGEPAIFDAAQISVSRDEPIGRLTR